jgi:hypothetical protein
MVLKLSDLNGEKREEFLHPKVGFITSTYNNSITSVSANGGVFEVFKYNSACLGGDDCLYFGSISGQPQQNIEYYKNEIGHILKFDPKTEKITKFIIDGEALGFSPLICGQDGNIYTFPGVGSTIYKLDVFNESISPIVDSGVISNSDNYTSGCLSSNGKIYAVPAKAASVLKIDPVEKTATTFGSFSSSGEYKWQGAILAPNGKIYGTPYRSTAILEIDTETDTVSTFGNVTGGWVGGCLSSNGKIYCPPYSGEVTTSILKIDPIARTATTFGSIDLSYFTPFGFSISLYYGWQGAILAPNGKIYCSPIGGTGILEINPENDTVNIIGIESLPPYASNLSAPVRWTSFVMAPDGKMYAPPIGENKILVLGETSNQEPADWLLSPYCNKGP